jgi:hypothetical protein
MSGLLLTLDGDQGLPFRGDSLPGHIGREKAERPDNRPLDGTSSGH